ncbi:MAG: hypothetical protein AAF567_24265 [Actinomycetota bacterium]
MSDREPLTSEVLEARQFELAKLVVSEAVRTLAEQGAELERIRSRSYSQVGLIGALATFLLGTILRSVGPSSRSTEFWFFAIVATALAIGMFTLHVRMWRVVPAWSTKVRTETMNVYVDHGTVEAVKALAGHYDKARVNNESVLVAARAQFWSATLASLALIAWLVLMLWRLA